MALNIDGRMMKVLEKSDCLKYYNCFFGVTRDQLDKLSMPRLTSKLKNLFNSNNIPDVERDAAVEKIVLELIRSAPEVADEDEHSNLPFPLLPIKKEENISDDEMNDDNNEVVHDQNMEPEAPQHSEQEQQQNNTNQAEVEEDEIQVVAEVPGEVAVLRVRVKPEPANETIILTDESDEENNATTSQNNVDEQNEAGSVLQQIVRRKDFKPKKVQKVLAFHPRLFEKLNNIECAHVRLSVDLPPVPSSSSSSSLYKRKRSSTTTPTSSRRSLSRQKRTSSNNDDDDNNSNLSASSSSSSSFAQWKTLYENIGRNIFAIDLVNWTWKPRDPQCHLNLFMILSKWCPNLGELNILANSQEMNINDSQDTGTVEFQTQKLKKLKIHHDDTINYESVLKYIIVSAVALEEIEFVYLHEVSLHRLLDVLTTLHDVHLSSLRNLYLFPLVEEMVALTGSEIEKISKIRCLNLEELFLDFAMMDEAHVYFEQLLKIFSKLKSLRMDGCFVTTAIQEPDIVIDFPKLDHLEYLNMGGPYKNAEILQNVNERPPKRKSRGNIIRSESEQGPSESGGSNNNNDNRDNNDEDENYEYPEFFPVNLNLPTLPKLETLILGNLFCMKDLHFSCFPGLKEFRVSGPWHLSVRFPTLNRLKTYPKIIKLQLPDSLRDHTFVSKIAEHFPNIAECFINLPSVKVVRAFAKCMTGSKLKRLELTTQFDFPSSLDACFLDKPLTVNDQSEEEKGKIRILKEYKFWKEYVEFYGIDVPDYENENDDGLLGLESLFKKGCKVLRIFHTPRTLRLPKGDIHFDDDLCEWSDTIIGYGKKKFPFSSRAWKASARDVEALEFDLSATSAKRKVLWVPDVLYEVDNSPSNISKKIEDVDPISPNISVSSNN